MFQLESALLVAGWILVDRTLNQPQHSLVRPWDLSVVLVALTGNLCGSLRLALPRLLGLKVLFLPAVASTRWVSELQALCFDPPFLIENPFSFTLVLNTAFHITLDIELSVFHLVCPVCMLRICLHRTTRCRVANRSLFVHWGEAKEHCRISKWWISNALFN